MMGRTAGRLMKRRVLGQIRYVTPVPPRAARGLVRDVYTQIERDFGMLAPPMALHSPAPSVLAAAWAMLRESLLVDGRAGRAIKETVAAAVSQANRCPYCVDVHGAAMSAWGLGDAAASLAAGQTIDDAQVRAAAAWAGGGGAPAGLPAAWMPELLVVLTCFHYLNRMVRVFLPDSPLPPLPPSARTAVIPVFGRLLRDAATVAPPAGASLRMVPASPDRPEPNWTHEAPVLAETFVRAGAAIDGAAGAWVPAAVREAVLADLARWDGRPPPLGSIWIDQVTDLLAPGDRPAARLALLTAKASDRVDEATVTRWRERESSDRALIELTSWAALAAADRLADLAAPAARGF